MRNVSSIWLDSAFLQFNISNWWILICFCIDPCKLGSPCRKKWIFHTQQDNLEYDVAMWVFFKKDKIWIFDISPILMVNEVSQLYFALFVWSVKDAVILFLLKPAMTSVSRDFELYTVNTKCKNRQKATKLLLWLNFGLFSCIGCCDNY